MTDPTRPHFRPDPEAMRARLVDMGESLSTAAAELARDTSIERVDLFMAKLQTALHFCQHLRRALAEELQGHGTG